MKTIDLAEKTVEVSKKPSKKYYPTIYYSDKGVGGVSSFDDSDIRKKITVQADLQLVGIRSSNSGEGKKFDYTFEVHKLHMPDDLSKQQQSIKENQSRKSKTQNY